MSETPAPLPFHDADLRLLNVEAVSQQMRVSQAFVRLCLAVGCPTRRGKLSAAELLHWLFDHYEEVRALAGFAPLATVDGVAEPAAQRIRMANALFTLLEFAQSRSSDLEQKIQLVEVRRCVEAALERCCSTDV